MKIQETSQILYGEIVTRTARAVNCRTNKVDINKIAHIGMEPDGNLNQC